MSLVLNTNISSLMAQNALTSSSGTLSTALEQLSTGLRINTAADDAAGYAIVQGMTSQINGMNQAEQNANDGVSLVQTASGALQEVTNDLQSMRSLAVESLNATNSGTDRSDLNTQFQQLLQDIDSVASNTQFNGVNLLDGSFQGATFQIGANEGQSIGISQIANMHTNALGAYTATGNVSGTALSAGDLVFTVGSQNYSVGASTAGSQGGQDAGSAYAVAAAINSADSGVTATASNTFTANAAPSEAANANTMAGSFTINGATVSISTGTLGNGAADDAANMAAAINDVSATSGVSASVNASNELVLTTTDGRNIDIGNLVSTSVTAAGPPATAALTLAAMGVVGTGLTATGGNLTGTINLSGSSAFTIGGTDPAHAGLTAETVDAISTTVANLNVSTVSNSNTALSTITAALQEVATLGAQLGAYQNRFQAAATGLATDITNLTSARSNIQDTDYASATSQLSQAQILQQAGTAMVAQANMIPQNVLTLLQKLP
ncbi:MAG TPA: flagellin [Steroidobacteraceae bacterium]|nr:flagellin [Steroidobacteraceae bacterium]